MFKHAPQRTRYCPDYLTSRDAIVSVIEKQKSFIQRAINDRLKHITDWGFTYLATPSQLCEALLRATGNWIE